ncbi:MAG: sigma-70 family RNA polymerase sigma factor [Pseudohongiellaceae bacterium]|nr:sigma-70 family RNA polymerase sigma factor [Pseudohongiellaceae bacterium]
MNIDIDELIRKCREHDPLAWEALVKTFQGRVYAMCYYYLKNSHEAEEVAQDTFVLVYRKFEQYVGKGSGLAPWILAIARNACIDRTRYNGARLPNYQGPDEDSSDPPIVDEELGPEGQQMMNQSQALIYQALAHTSAQTRELILLRDIQGLKLQEIAHITGLPLGTIKSRCNRAKVELARIINKIDPSYARPGTLN